MDYILNENGLRQIDMGFKNVVSSNGFDSFFSSVNSYNNTGVSVTPRSSLTYSSVYQAVQIISGDVARIQLDVYQPDGEDRKRRPKHPAFKLLNRAASQWLSGYGFRETLQAHALLWGNGYARIEFDSVGRPSELVILDPATVRPEVVDGELIYKVGETTDQKGYEVYPAYKIFHIKGMGFDGIQGFSVVSLARDSWGLGMAAERHGSRFFKQGARPNVVLKHPAYLDQDAADQLVESFQSKHSGVDGVGRPALAAGGLEIVPLSIPNTDSQWLESREFQRVEVASWFSLPPHKLGDSSRMAYNSIEAEERAYASQTLMRWFERWESEIDMKLLTAFQYQNNWFSEHDISKLVQGDSETQVDTIVKLRSAMVITQNEARNQLNYPAVEGGDEFENPATSTGEDPETVPEEQEPTEEPEPEETIQEKAAAVLRSRVEQFDKTYRKQASALESKPERLIAFSETFSEKMYDGLMPLVDLVATISGRSITEEELQINIAGYIGGENKLCEGILND